METPKVPQGGGKDKVVDAMIGICVHNPRTFIEPPSNVKQTAAYSLSEGIKGASLSPNAKTAFMIVQGNQSFEDSEKQARIDLPDQLKKWMKQQGLSPDNYTFDYFDESLQSDLKILWGVAIKNPTLVKPVSPSSRP